MKKNNYKKYFLSLVFLCSLFGFSQQTDLETNIQKYWNYRERMRNNFISIGDKAGQSLPFGTRNEREKGKLSQGEGPIMLGHYMAVLATEYKLLNLENADTSQTIKELYYALYAFNRLDLIAETVNGYNKKPALDGFFVREDFPSDFVDTNLSLNEHIINKKSFITGSAKSFKVKCTTHKGDKLCGLRLNDNCEISGKPNGYSAKYNHRPMSMDQILGILIGVSMVNNMLDENVTYLDNVFQDNETSLKKEAQQITDRILTYAKKNLWTPKEPDDTYIGDCGFRNSKPNFFKNNTTIAVFSRFFSKIGKQVTGKRYGYIPIIGVFDGVGSIQADNFKGAFYNRRMYIEMMTLSNKDNNLFYSTAKRVKRASTKYNWEPFYYTMGQLLHHWKKDFAIEKQTLQMLNFAPKNGTYFHGVNDFSKNGWAAENRFTATLGEQYYGSRFIYITGNYIGLDYMLLHNMYLLAYHKNVVYANNGKEEILITPINTASKLSLKKCLKAKKQSCTERYNHYKFLYKNSFKNCKDSKEKCKVKIIKSLNQQFKVDFNPNQKKCQKSELIKYCN